MKIYFDKTPDKYSLARKKKKTFKETKSPENSPDLTLI